MATTDTQYTAAAAQPGLTPAYDSNVQRLSLDEKESIDSPIHYTRDPQRLIAYLIPFPAPTIHQHLIKSHTPVSPPLRFLIYTPPPPPLVAPAEGEKEGKLHKVQRKWENEVREAKTNPQKIKSWKGMKGRVTKGVDVAMSWTKSSSLDFLGRVPEGKVEQDKHSDDGVVEGDETKKTVGLEEIVLIHPEIPGVSPEQLKEEFINNMLRSKSKAEKDAIISTGLIPVAFGIDILCTLIWPFGGLGEIDSVWAYANIRGAKTSRSVTKRLNSSGTSADSKLKLTFTPSPRLEVLSKYLETECHDRDSKLFPKVGVAPTDDEALKAIGWTPKGETKNWEDEQWEIMEVKEDLKQVMHKGAKEWDKWCKLYDKNPEKAMKK